MAAAYTIRTKILPQPEQVDIKWCLDTPVNSQHVFYDDLIANGLRFSGWFLQQTDIESAIS